MLLLLLLLLPPPPKVFLLLHLLFFCLVFLCRKELREDQYDKADEYFKNKMIIMRTTELLINDLDLYYKALDQ